MCACVCMCVTTRLFLENTAVKPPAMKLLTTNDVHQFPSYSLVKKEFTSVLYAAEPSASSMVTSISLNTDYRPLCCVSCLIRRLCSSFPPTLPLLSHRSLVEHNLRVTDTRWHHHIWLSFSSRVPSGADKKIWIWEQKTKHCLTVESSTMGMCWGALHGPYRYDISWNNQMDESLLMLEALKNMMEGWEEALNLWEDVWLEQTLDSTI